MGDLMPGIPSIPGDETTWASFVDQFETLKKGDNSVSLINWDTGTDTVSIAAGSSIEIAGAAYRFTSDEAVTGGADGVAYVMILGGVPTLVNDPPVWRDDLNGWYNATGDGRYTGHLMDKTGASYENKRAFSGNKREGNHTLILTNGVYSSPLKTPGLEEAATSRTLTEYTIEDGSDEGLVPAGTYYVYCHDVSDTSSSIEIFLDDASWQTIAKKGYTQIYSNGVNYRWIIESYTPGATALVRLVKII